MRDELLALQEWLREPDAAENFGTDQVVEWINRRLTHIIPRVLAALRARASHGEG